MIALYKHNVCLASKPAVISFVNVFAFSMLKSHAFECVNLEKILVCRLSLAILTMFFNKKFIRFLKSQRWKKKLIFLITKRTFYAISFLSCLVLMF